MNLCSAIAPSSYRLNLNQRHGWCISRPQQNDRTGPDAPWLGQTLSMGEITSRLSECFARFTVILSLPSSQHFFGD
jgi:hypothetical protein